MPNIAALLKGEIIRLSNRTARQHLGPLRSASTLHRHQLAGLRKQVKALEREVSKLRRAAASSAEPQATPGDASNIRFVAKGLQTLRARLGLSAKDFGALVGASAASVYNWEHKKAKPLSANIIAIAGLRDVGKREAHARLKRLGSSKRPSQKK